MPSANGADEQTGESPIRSLSELLVEARAKFVHVRFNKRNKFHNYDYADSEAVIDAGRRALQSAGLALIRESHSIVYPPEMLHPGVRQWDGESGRGVPTEFVPMLRSTYKLFGKCEGSMMVHSETPIVVEKGRPMDKAVAAAETLALAYAMRDTLSIKRDAKDEVNGRDDTPQHVETIGVSGMGDLVRLLRNAGIPAEELIAAVKETAKAKKRPVPPDDMTQWTIQTSQFARWWITTQAEQRAARSTKEK